jgi:hypothetical protein
MSTFFTAPGRKRPKIGQQELQVNVIKALYFSGTALAKCWA